MTITTRNDFGKLIDALSIKRGAELGVAEGRYSDHLLSTSALECLACVDKWNDERHPDSERMKAANRLVRHGARANVVHSTFEAALSSFADESLDFIYIDGYAHTGQEGGRTLLDWWPKLRKGGVFAGHDYHVAWPKTMSAVNRFVAMLDLPLYLTSADEFPSWYVFKPGGDKMRNGEAIISGREGCPVAVGKSCILVGNGASLKLGQAGSRIDAFDEVVRFNDFQIRGYEGAVGTKTTMWVAGGRNKIPTDVARPEKMLFMHGETGNPGYPALEVYRVPMTFFNDLRERVRDMSQRQDKKPLLPSAGLVATSWLLHLGATGLTLAGFDHFSRVQSASHHYWLGDRKYGPPNDHDPDVEASIFSEMIESGRVSRL